MPRWRPRGRSTTVALTGWRGEVSARWGLQKSLSLKHAPPGRPSRCPPPTLRQPHPKVRGAALNGAAGMWGLRGCRALPGLHTCLWPACGHCPQGPGQCGGRQPRRHSMSRSGPQGARVQQAGGPVFAHPPLPCTRPDRLWRGGRGPRWDAGEPRFTGPNAVRRQSPVCQQDNWRRFSLLPQPGVRGRGSRLPHRPRRTCT